VLEILKYENKTIPFGVHKGELICDIPSDYLYWLLEQEWFSKKFKELVPIVDMELKYRRDFNIEP